MSSADDVAANVAAWTRKNAEYLDGGAYRVPESELGILGDVAGLDVVELGCGTAFFAARLARLGARVVGVDPTPSQLETARRMMAQTGIEFPLVEAPGESVPLPDASFDLALSEHGAATWADPASWLPEAARLLRPGGRLVFVHGTPLAYICFPETGEITTELHRSYFELGGRIVWEDGEGGVEHQLTHGGWIEALRDAGFEIERLIELQAPPHAVTHEYYSDMTAEWAKRWPGEEIWVARKRS
jgi:ubiquinone/menaquinone biosynthesis C-methylase UbiE